MIRKTLTSAIISVIVRMFFILRIHMIRRILWISVCGEIILDFRMIVSISDSTYLIYIFLPLVGMEPCIISTAISVTHVLMFLGVSDSKINLTVFSINNTPKKNGKRR